MADPIATAADYADAMITARQAKKLLFLLLLLMLLAQLAIFFVARYTDTLPTAPPSAAGDTPITANVEPTTAPATQDDAAAAGGARENRMAVLRYLVNLIDFLGIALTIVMASVLLLIVNIMLVGRLIGVGRLTSAYLWTLVLAVLLFPWQAFLEDYAWKLPGVLYTWDELVRHAKFPNEPLEEAILKWARFVAMPVVAVILLFVIQAKSNRGLRQALGEGADVDASGTLA